MQEAGGCRRYLFKMEIERAMKGDKKPRADAIGPFMFFCTDMFVAWSQEDRHHGVARVRWRSARKPFSSVCLEQANEQSSQPMTKIERHQNVLKRDLGENFPQFVRQLFYFTKNPLTSHLLFFSFFSSLLLVTSPSPSSILNHPPLNKLT